MIPPRIDTALVRRGALVALAFVSSLLSGQSVNTPAAPLPASSQAETILLSPFEVRTDGDAGYTAASALAGGRTDAPLKLTPAAISVMTNQFLEDIGATNFRGAGEWSLNWVPQPEVNTGVAGGFAVNYRNMGSSFASRNYFLWYVESDSYNTERYEFARGPNGVLFGDAGAGGISTTWTKRPRFDRATSSVNTRFDSFGGYRASIDFSRPLSRRLALRLNSYYDASPSWRDHTHNDRFGTHLAGLARLTPKNQFRFEGEFGIQNRSIYPNYYTDQSSYWDRVTGFNGSDALSTAGTGVARISTSNYYLYVPGTPNGGLNDWNTFYQSTGTGLGLLPTGARRADMPNAPALPGKRFNFQPPDAIARLYYYTYSLYLDHRFNDNLFVEVAYNRLRNDRHSHGTQTLFNAHRLDVNTHLPGGVLNPNFGTPYTDAERVKSLQGNIVHDVRALANWRFETRWLKQSVSIIAGSRLDRFDSWSRTLRRVKSTNPNLTAAINLFRERRYWDQAGQKLGPVPQIPGITLDYVATAISHQRKNLDYAQIASTSRFFDDRLAVMLGARRDDVTNSQQTTSGIPATAGTGLPQLGAVITPAGSTAPVPVVGAKSIGEFAPVSTNAGAVYFLRPWLGVFANYSETFAAPNNGANLIDGGAPDISQSKGKDFGFKLELFEGRVSGSVSYYTSRQVKLLINGTRATEINRIWTNLNRVDLASLSYRDTQDLKGDGYEVDLTANPTRNLRLTFNLALPRTAAVNLEPGLVGYANAHLAAWQAAAAGSNNPNQVNNDITTIRTYIASLTPGTPLNNTYKHTANLYATYTFPSGLLRNFSLGAGANIRGRAKIASTLANAYDYLYADAHRIVAAHATYRHRFGRGLNARFQLNVSNLFDSDALIANTYSTYRVGGLASNPLVQVPGTLRIPEPRKFTLSATFDF